MNEKPQLPMSIFKNAAIIGCAGLAVGGLLSLFLPGWVAAIGAALAMSSVIEAGVASPLKLAFRLLMIALIWGIVYVAGSWLFASFQHAWVLFALIALALGLLERRIAPATRPSKSGTIWGGPNND